MNRTAAWRRPAGPFRLPRVLVIVLLAFGVAGMHTFGHAEGSHHEPVHHSAVAHAAPFGSLTQHTQATAEELPSAAALEGSNPGGGLDLDVFSVCLAVLGALGLAIWVALVRLRSSYGPHVARLFSATRGVGRAPPIALLGLRVAAVTVLRI